MTKPRTLNPVSRLAAPMRRVRAWIFRERAVAGSGAIQLDALEQHVAAEEAIIATATTEATEIKDGLENLRAKVAAALTDQETPGIIDAREARALSRDLIDVGLTTHRHQQTLESLT